jgi:hypothetical protein
MQLRESAISRTTAAAGRATWCAKRALDGRDKRNARELQRGGSPARRMKKKRERTPASRQGALELREGVPTNFAVYVLIERIRWSMSVRNRSLRSEPKGYAAPFGFSSLFFFFSLPSIERPAERERIEQHRARVSAEPILASKA